MPDKWSNVPSNIVYSAIGPESVRISRISNSPDVFSTTVNHFSPVWVCKMFLLKKISSILKTLTKHQKGFNNASESKEELLDFVS